MTDDDRGVWGYALIIPGLLVLGVALLVWSVVLVMQRDGRRRPAGVFLVLVAALTVYAGLVGLGLAPIP